MTTRKVRGKAGGNAGHDPRRGLMEAQGAPRVDFAEGSPYDSYVHERTLHRLVQPWTEHPAEPAFLVTTQIMELYFHLLRIEWERAQRQLRADDLDAAIESIDRSVRHLKGLNGVWESLAWLGPAQFNAFRPQLGEASGFQSYAYRHVEFLLGLKSQAMCRPHRSVPDVYAELQTALAAPSLYDDVLAYLARTGLPVAREAYDRDFTAEYEPRDDVERMWVAVYRDARAGNRLFTLAESLSDVVDQFSIWRHRHLVAVRRTIGSKPGSGGSSGIAWLERSLARPVFPELFSARTWL
jgi:tryptophan 2,3-dioxygenase